MKIFLQNCEVVQVKGRVITISLGSGVHIHIHMLADHAIKEGDTLPLYTETPNAIP